MKWILLALFVAGIYGYEEGHFYEHFGITNKQVVVNRYTIDDIYGEYVIGLKETEEEYPFLELEVNASDNRIWVTNDTTLQKIVINAKQNVVCFDEGIKPNKLIFNGSHNTVYMDYKFVALFHLRKDESQKVFVKYNETEKNIIKPREGTCEEVIWRS